MKDESPGDELESRSEELDREERRLELDRRQLELRRARLDYERQLKDFDETEYSGEQATVEATDSGQRTFTTVVFSLGGAAALLAIVLLFRILYVIPDRISADASAARAQSERRSATPRSMISDQQAAELLMLQLAARPSSPNDRVAILDTLLGLLGSDIPAAAKNQLRDIIETGGDALTNIATAVKTFREAFQSGAPSIDGGGSGNIDISIGGCCCKHPHHTVRTEEVRRTDPPPFSG